MTTLILEVAITRIDYHLQDGPTSESRISIYNRLKTRKSTKSSIMTPSNRLKPPRCLISRKGLEPGRALRYSKESEIAKKNETVWSSTK